MKQGKFADAEQLLRDTVDLFAPNLQPDHQYIASAEHYLGEALLGQRKYEEAEPVLIAAMERWKRGDAPAWRSARSASALGEVLHRQRRMQQAEVLLVDSFHLLKADAGADEDSKRAARERLTELYKDLGQPRKLDAMLAEETQRRTSASRAPDDDCIRTLDDTRPRPCKADETGGIVEATLLRGLSTRTSSN